MLKLILLFAILHTGAEARDYDCEYFTNCTRSQSSTFGKSMPSTASSTSFNPSSVAHAKGVGFEVLLQPNNPIGFMFLSGTGKVGAALVSTAMENSFFGNRTIELDSDHEERMEEKKRYKNKKLELAFGAALINKRNIGLDVGVSARRNSDTKKIHPGIAFSTRLGIFNFGGNFYKDDTKIIFGDKINYQGYLYRDLYGIDEYSENFNVTTLSAGINYKAISLDVGKIKAKYKFYENPTEIMLYSASYQYQKFLFNFAYRMEESDNFTPREEREKSDYYAGVKYGVSNHLVVGLAYNAFLIDDASLTLDFYF